MRDGWTVFGTGRSTKDLAELQKKYPAFIPITVDFRSNRDIERVAEVVKNSKLKLSILVHNAGITSPPRSLSKYNPAQIDEVVLVDLLAPMKLSALLSNYMLPESRMLFITSTVADLLIKETITYCASKAALNKVAAILRKELAPQTIGVQAVIPGEVDTYVQYLVRNTKTFHLHKKYNEAYEKGRLIKPEVCAAFLKWLLCDLPFDKYSTGYLPISIYDMWHRQFWLKDDKDLLPFTPKG